MAQGLQLSQRLTQSLGCHNCSSRSRCCRRRRSNLKALVEQELQQNPVLEEERDSQAENRAGKGNRRRPRRTADPTEPRRT